MVFVYLWLGVEAHACEIEKLVKPGEAIVLLFEMGLSFMVHFFACLRVKAIAVPCYPPVPGNEQKGIDAVTRVLKDSNTKVVLMSPAIEKLKRMRGRWISEVEGHKVDYVTLKIRLYERTSPACPFPESEEMTFIQYTSGSTGDPKGVCIGHDTYQNNVALTAYWNRNSRDGSMLPADQASVTSWLPMYHDMGLSLAISSTLFCGDPCYLMSPFDFLRDPLIWLDILSETKSTHSVAPNFAYGLVVRKWDSVRAKKWDLSHVRALGNSSEPVIRSTVESFIAMMARDVPSWDPLSYCPGYGMAEAVAYIGGSLFKDPMILSKTNPDHIASIPLCNARIDSIRVVDLASIETGATICAPSVEGEVWISTWANARGYWKRPELTEAAFHNVIPSEGDRHWLRTGDLGYIDEDGHLYISGRSKDVIIINGRNFWPQDIENVVSQAHEAVRPGCVIAFGVESGDTQAVAVVCEVRDSFLAKYPSPSFLKDAVTAIQQAVRMLIARDCKHIIFIKERTIPKTTSGKGRRSEAKN